MRSGQCLVIGIGNLDRGDDGVGRIVARRLSTQHPLGAHVIEHDGEPAGIVDRLSAAEAAYLIDASSTGEGPGAIHRFDVADKELPRIALGCSTHGLGLVEAIELARALGKLPRPCIVYAIEGRTYELGAALSPEVAAAADEVAKRIRDEMRRQSEG